MKLNTFITPIILVASLILGGCVGLTGRYDFDVEGSVHGSEADADSAAAVLQAYSDAINAEDMDAMAALVVADERFSVIEGGHANWGWVDYSENHLGPEFASERISFQIYGYHDINVRAGDMFAYATFSYAFEATLDGEPYNKSGLGTAVLMRTPDGWRITHLQTS